MNETTETIEGYIIDVACVRKSPRQQLFERAQRHSRDCALMGHWAESGFALVTENGQVAILDSEATLMILDLGRRSPKSQSIKAQVTRQPADEKMETVRVEEID